MERIIRSFAISEDRAGQIETAFQEAVDLFVDQMREFDAIRLIEVGRLAFLPWSPARTAHRLPERQPPMSSSWP
jgi:hypothetical protein